VIIVEGFELMCCPFKPVGVVELGIVIDSDPFDLVLQLASPSSTLENLLYLPLRFLVVDNREGRVRPLSW
jgi:hypothetical protein